MSRDSISPSERSSNSTSSDSATIEQAALFLDEEDDPLIPSLQDVHCTFLIGKATWEEFLGQAMRLPQGMWPTDALNPFATLVDVPSLPNNLPRRELFGRPCWELPRDFGVTECQNTHLQSDETSLQLGRLVKFQLQTNNPIRCDICPDDALHTCASFVTTNSLTVLVMCWSYILSARLLEMQRHKIRYTEYRLQPVVPNGQKDAAVDINLKGASGALTRWLCAILNPTMGWQADDDGDLPPWATSFKPCVRLVLEASDMAADITSAPSSIEAVELLIELCQLFDLGPDIASISNLEPLLPYKASFLAALAIPFYGFMKLQPLLPKPYLIKPQKRGTFNSSHAQQIREYFRHLGYFMTLSAHPPFVGSIIWSVFWQPDVNCNLVGPWLTSVLVVLEPIIALNRTEILLKVFLSRRPRIGIWWVALFLLGDPALFNWIRRYTVKAEEKRYYTSLTSPDPIVSAWTGSKQSFVDCDNDSIYLQQADLVSRADLLRCRFDAKLQQECATSLSWRPFGDIKKKQVELEIWPQLETKYTRSYNAFVWYLEESPSKYKKYSSIRDDGFRKNTGLQMTVPDNLEMHTSTMPSKERSYHAIHMRPSIETTCRMMNFLVEDSRGDRHWEHAGFSVEKEQVRWLHDWEGLLTMDQIIRDAGCST
ncbi:hypothetical protein FBULB1_13341 [Fusarium bulbicola]|nr:hypothetical protein FBULB1_13341 [Fusarium bulbicola]